MGGCSKGLDKKVEVLLTWFFANWQKVGERRVSVPWRLLLTSKNLQVISCWGVNVTRSRRTLVEALNWKLGFSFTLLEATCAQIYKLEIPETLIVVRHVART